MVDANILTCEYDIDPLTVASIEKEAYISVRSEDAKVSNDKVKIARKQYRGQGQYIEEILL